MNDTARRIGAKESNFRNANGLDASGHYSTAYDVAILSRYALKKPTLAQIFARQRVYLTWEGGKSEVVNINSFLWRYSGAFGLKTGYTQDAGYLVSAAAKHGSRSLIVVLLGCPSSDARWSDAERLMDYGFQHYSTLVAAAAVRVTGRIYIVKTGDTLYGIASRLGVTVADLIKTNKALATNPNRLLPGQSLVIP
jgi:D-alanyl-D-alanine carboxypeptidase (penicillin-binding protein 5/6)